MPRSQDATRWVDFDTLVRESVTAFHARNKSSRSSAADIEQLVQRGLRDCCATQAEIVRMVGGRMEYQDKAPDERRGPHLRSRAILSDGEVAVFETDQAFLDWIQGNRPRLKALVERERLAAVALGAKASPCHRASRAL